jgi:peptidoglycan L-alanyl-D-glutamate endopeptidase CwlK
MAADFRHHQRIGHVIQRNGRVQKVILDARSKSRLAGVHPELVHVIQRAADLDQMDFIVTEGVRSLEKQKILLEKGATTTLKSRHLTGHAVDLAVLIDGVVRWDWPLYHRLADLIKEAAHIEDIPIEAGADWVKFPDGPHFQLPWKAYP